MIWANEVHEDEVDDCLSYLLFIIHGDLFLSKPTLHPAAIHFELLGAVDEQSSIYTKVFYFKDCRKWCRGSVGISISISSLGLWLFELCRERLTGPDVSELFLLEKVHPGSVTADVEVLLQVAALLEPHLGEITSSIVAEANLAAWLQEAVGILDRPPPLARVQGGEDEDHDDDVDRALPQAGREVLAGGVPHVSLHVVGIVRLVGAHDFNGLFRKVTGMDLELGVLILRQDGEGGVARAGAHLQQRHGAGVFLRDLTEDRELLLEPLAVLEEVGRVVLVEEVPPFGRIRIEPVFARKNVSEVAPHEDSMIQKIICMWLKSDGSERLKQAVVIT